jgi:hypothetical protein
MRFVYDNPRQVLGEYNPVEYIAQISPTPRGLHPAANARQLPDRTVSADARCRAAVTRRHLPLRHGMAAAAAGFQPP